MHVASHNWHVIIISLHVLGSVNGVILKQPKYGWSRSLYKRTSIVFSSLAVALVTGNIYVSHNTYRYPISDVIVFDRKSQ